jgi:hypothetical protein
MTFRLARRTPDLARRTPDLARRTRIVMLMVPA